MKIHPDEQALLARGGKPTLADLLDKMTFSPSKGSIDLNGARMVLTRATFGADLQDELVRRYGEHEAMVLLLRLGYRNGREDAEFVRRSWPNLDIGDAFTAGTRIHMVSGTVRVETMHNDFDFKSDRFSGDFLWHDSVEAGEYARRHGRATGPVCWAQTGYAAGYASVFFRKLILYKEVSCAAMGDKSCRVIGKTVDGWGKNDPFVRTFLDEVLVTRAATPARLHKTGLTQAGSSDAVLEDMIVAPVRGDLERLTAAGLSTLITGPEGSGCYKAAVWLHEHRFHSGQMHRVHAATGTLEPALKAIRDALATKTAPEQTLIIESIEDLPHAAQFDLIDLLQTEEAAPRKLMVAGISNKSLADLRKSGALRAELLHAISILPITMPSLSQRSDDISLFADIYLSHLTSQEISREAHLTPDARSFITSADWPGNLPELRSVTLRAALNAADQSAINADDFRAALWAYTPKAVPVAKAGLEHLWQALVPHLDAGTSLPDVTAWLERKALDDAEGNISAAARRLGLTRAQLDYRLKAASDTAPDLPPLRLT